MRWNPSADNELAVGFPRPLLHTMLEGPLESVCECKMDVKSRHGFLHGIQWTMSHGHLDSFRKPPPGGRPNTKLWDHGTLSVRNIAFILLYHARGPFWIENHRDTIWLRAWSHMTSHYPWGSVATLHDFGGGLGTTFGHIAFFWALTISWSWLLARLWSGPNLSQRAIWFSKPT